MTELVDLGSGCPGCDRRDVHPDDLCGCDLPSGPMCPRCCTAMHDVRAWLPKGAA